MDLMKLILSSTGSNNAVEKLFNKIRDKQPLKPPKPSGAATTRSSPVKSLYSGSGSTKLGRNDNRDGKLISRPIPVKEG